MNAIFKKLNLKDQTKIFILNAPESFHANVGEISQMHRIKTNLRGVSEIEFILIFVTKKSEIDNTVLKIKDRLCEDALLWFAYPKGTSKKYTCDFNRDTGWDSLGKLGFEGVRMIAIDEDWSALRFRNAANIKNMTRRKSMALSKEGKKKTQGN